MNKKMGVCSIPFLHPSSVQPLACQCASKPALLFLPSSPPPSLLQLHALLSMGRTVYVHCTAGINRATLTVVGYLTFIQVGRREARRLHEFGRGGMGLVEGINGRLVWLSWPSAWGGVGGAVMHVCEG